ncbi:MAG TPA: invasin domain 3-containing protein, partial [Gemmatimonadales bacterium]|nr:invasin domain 3-containing protein [Gemmatimonadales bacterium]
MTPPPSGTFAVTPAQVIDSAAVGSTAPRVGAIRITVSGAGTAAWVLSRALGSAWLVPEATSGTTPDTIDVTLNPQGLPVGAHQDTLIISAAANPADPTRVPVQFIIYPCVPEQVAFGTTMVDTLHAGDCAYSGNPRRFARVYRFEGVTGDSISVWLTSSSFAPRVLLDSVPPGAAPLGNATNCSVLPGSACLRYFRLPRSGTYGVAATTVDSARTGAYTLEVNRPRAPSAPAALTQVRRDSTSIIAVGETVADGVVLVRGRVSDPDAGDSVRLEVEVRPIATPFTGSPTDSGSFGVSGRETLVPLSGLSDNATYRWRARARDNTGRVGTWLEFAGATGADFGVAIPEAPAPPTDLSQLKADATTPIAPGGVTDERTVVLRGRVSDPDPGDLLRLEVEIQLVDSVFQGVPHGSSVEVPGSSLATVTIAGLADDRRYHWQARTIDRSGRASAWVRFSSSAQADLEVAAPEPPAPPTALRQLAPDSSTSVPIGDTVDTRDLVLAATVTDPDPNAALRLQVEVRPVGTSFIGIATDSSGPVGRGGTAFVRLVGLADDADYHWQARALDETGRVSGWSAYGGNAETTADFRVAVPAVAMAFAVQPAALTAGASITPAVKVVAVEASGATDAAFNGVIDLSLAGAGATGAPPEAGPASATLQGTTSARAVNGVATFAELRVDTAGSYRLVASATNLPPVTSNAFQVNPGPASPTRSAITASPTSLVANGAATATITVRLRDALGNNLTTGGAIVSLATTLGTLSGVTDNGDGTYTAILTSSTTTGAATITGTVGGVAIADDAVVTFVAGAAAPAMTTIGASPDSIVANGSATSAITVQLRDANGNSLSAGGSAVFLSTTAGTLSAVTDNGNGTYGATLTAPTVTGTATITGTLDGTTITDNATVTFVAGPAVAARSTAAVPSGVAGLVTNITIQARDAFGNPLTSGGATVTVVITGANVQSPAVTDNGNGTYTAVYTPVAAGTDNVAITLNGTAISGSPFTSTVSAGSQPSVTLSANVTSVGEGGGSATVTATLSSQFGMPVTIDLGFAGTAMLTTDFLSSGTQIVIPAGSTTGTVTITAVQDELDEVNETVIVAITGVTNGTEDGAQQVTVTIADDDAPPAVAFAGAAQSNLEGVATVTATVQLSAASGLAVSVPFTVGGTATGG